VTDLGQRRLSFFGEEQPTLDLASQNPVLLRQIFVSLQQFLFHCSGDMGEQARPEHLGFLHNLKLRER
jgi:hypothetical protein